MEKGNGLVLSRKLDEEIVIGDNIVVSIAYINGSRVGIRIKAPDEIIIVRSELLEKNKVQEAVA